MRGLYVILVLLYATNAKIFEKCELANLLRTKFLMSEDEVGKWVCTAEFESTFNTAAVNEFNWDGSKDFGLFQLNNRYWCGDDPNPGDQNVCGISCQQLLDDDITDDMACAQLIRREWVTHKPVTEGLLAWVAFKNRCYGRDFVQYMSDCDQTAVDANIVPPLRETEKDKKPVKLPSVPAETPSSPVKTPSIPDKVSSSPVQTPIIPDKLPSIANKPSILPAEKPSIPTEEPEKPVPSRASGSGIFMLLPAYASLSPGGPPVVPVIPGSKHKVAPPAVINFADPLWFKRT